VEQLNQGVVHLKTNRKLIVITGPSGVGKGSLVKQLLEKYKNIWLSVSATTRTPREGEIDGEDYFFWTKDKFETILKNNGFLEWAEFAGNFYGTPSHQVDSQLSMGRTVLLEIELEGARQIRSSSSECLQVFIAPPTFEELELRIRKRGTDAASAVKSRLERAKEEMKAQNEFDAVVINDELNVALAELEKIIGLIH